MLEDSLWDTIRVGDKINGKITSVKPFGALVSLDYETNGLIQTSFINKNDKTLTVGRNIDVVVISIKETNRVKNRTNKQRDNRPREKPKSPKRRNRSKRNSENHSRSTKSNGRIKPSNDGNRNKKRDKRRNNKKYDKKCNKLRGPNSDLFFFFFLDWFYCFNLK